MLPGYEDRSFHIFVFFPQDCAFTLHEEEPAMIKSRKLKPVPMLLSLTLAVGTLGLVAVSPSLFAAATTSKMDLEQEPQDPACVGQVLRAAGITPEALAAAGVSALEFDALVDFAQGYCLQADRVAQIQLASKNLNLAKARAVTPPSHSGGNGPGGEPNGQPPQTVAQAKTVLDSLTSDAFTFTTGSLPAEKRATLAKIRANQHWGLPAPYLVADRTTKQWIALRSALAAKRYADQKHTPLPEQAATVLSEAHADPAITAARSSYDSTLAARKTQWKQSLGR